MVLSKNVASSVPVVILERFIRARREKHADNVDEAITRSNVQGSPHWVRLVLAVGVYVCAGRDEQMNELNAVVERRPVENR